MSLYKTRSYSLVKLLLHAPYYTLKNADPLVFNIVASEGQGVPTHFRVGEAIWHVDGLQGIYEHVRDPDVSIQKHVVLMHTHEYG